MNKKKILFLTGTRADYGKLKSLMKAIEAQDEFHLSIFVTGMHTLKKYGLTEEEIKKEKFNDIFIYQNQIEKEPMDLILSNTIVGLSRYISEYPPDMIVVHGDRVEALAAAITGSLNNILVSHIEGGELSGTVDGMIRHAISKLSHYHFVSNSNARKRLIRMGENPSSIFVIGSPEVDTMLSESLPSISKVKERYEITFDEYSIVLFHSVTTELENMYNYSTELVSAIIQSNKNYVVIYPNNDVGCQEIFRAYKELEGRKNIRILPSMRFEYFLTLLKNAKFIIGNSSCGVREAPIYGIYSINIGTRQKDRSYGKSILNVNPERTKILKTINSIDDLPEAEPSFIFGRGDSTKKFLEKILNPLIWENTNQKDFFDSGDY